MIIQPNWGTRNVNKYFYASEAKYIAMLNEIFGDVDLNKEEMDTLIWLAGWDKSTVENFISAVKKAIEMEIKNRP